MSSIFFGKRKPYSKYGVLWLQQQLIEQHYSFLSCTIEKNVLTCTGYLHPDVCSGSYKVKIEYVAGKEPRTTILTPNIEPSPKIHMYQDHSLCLHYPPDMRWDEKTKLYAYTIPWISEWIIFYELYLLNGNRWEGKESPVHINEDEKNINQDRD